jgi:hypothetical protein
MHTMNKQTVLSALLMTVAALGRVLSFACGVLVIGLR